MIEFVSRCAELFKRFLRRSSVAQAINARLKAAQLRYQRNRIQSYYSERASSRRFTYSPEWACSMVRDRLQARGLPRRARSDKKPHVFWIGANWNQDNSGFLGALQRKADVAWALMRSGEYGFRQRVHGKPYLMRDPEVIAENGERLLAQVKRVHAFRPLDLVWGQLWANYVAPDTLQAIRDLGIPVVNVAMDDRLPEHWASFGKHRLGSIGLGPAVDLVLTTSPECCAWYGVEGVPALFWPLASDPERFGPAPESQKRYDVSFVGNRYGIRLRIVERLIRAGLDVTAFGAGWPNGPVSAERTADIFARSRIILGIGTVGHNDDIFTLKLRDFDATMAGALYITHRNPDLLELYREGEEIECYGTVEECIEKIGHYLSRPDDRQRIAAAGRKRALLAHTWDQRIGAAMKAVGINL